jgi:6-phosphogluconate dehydrogenase
MEESVLANHGCDIGLIGVGVMGGNLVLNIADHGFSVAAYDVTAAKTRELIEKQAGDREIRAAYTLPELVGLLRRPRSIILLVPAGTPVDAVIGDLVPHLEHGDLLIDSGNSHFSDTNRRAKLLADEGLLFMGMGISGGESGARLGPSLMPGGSREGYDRVRAMLEAAAAHVNGEPCAAYMGAGSAGHYVKMVHNGIEYGVMQLISETYDLMKRGLGMKADSMAAVYERWNRTELDSYLLEITAPILRRRDEKKAGAPLIDMILDRARQKGTGMWMSQDAMELRVPTPNIDVAVMMRNLSGYRSERKAAAETLHGPETRFQGDGERFLEQTEKALYTGMITTYAQGMALLDKASRTYDYGLDPEVVAAVWRGGCIIRAGLLEDILAAYQARPDLPNIVMDTRLGREIANRQEALRIVVRTAADLGLPVPGLMASLAYWDAYRSGWLPTNLIQAQRDYFGAHTYERIDMDGVFHTVWSEE